jgi:hypothetical protein
MRWNGFSATRSPDTLCFTGPGQRDLLICIDLSITPIERRVDVVDKRRTLR